MIFFIFLFLVKGKRICDLDLDVANLGNVGG